MLFEVFVGGVQIEDVLGGGCVDFLLLLDEEGDVGEVLLESVFDEVERD